MNIRSMQIMLLAAAGSLLLSAPVAAFNMGNMMNPTKWMGGDKDGDRDRYDDYYDGPGYGYGGPPGYGYGGYPGYGYGGYPGYGYGGGGPGYGYGAVPGYNGGGIPGYGTMPGYGQPGAETRDQEVNRLRERLRQLEGEPR